MQRIRGDQTQCRVLHRNFKIIKIDQVKKTRIDYASYSLYLHSFIRKMKSILMALPDLNGVKMAFNHNDRVADFIAEVARLLAIEPQRRWMHVVVYKDSKIIFLGTVLF
jgi:hypothetical protein